MKLFDEWAGVSSDTETEESDGAKEAPAIQLDTSEETTESEVAEEEPADRSGENGKVTSNEAKRVRQLASVQTPDVAD